MIQRPSTLKITDTFSISIHGILEQIHNLALINELISIHEQTIRRCLMGEIVINTYKTNISGHIFHYKHDKGPNGLSRLRVGRPMIIAKPVINAADVLYDSITFSKGFH